MDENEATLASYEAGITSYLERTPDEPSALALWLCSLVGDIFAPGARVLEIGSAGGQDAAVLRDCGLVVQCTDAAAGFVEHLRTHGFPDAVRYDVRHDDPPPGQWDIVFANAVFPHLRREELGPVLRRLHDTLGDETVLFASVKIGEGEGWSTQKLGSARWYTYWQPDTFLPALAEGGWYVEEARVRTGRYDEWIAVIALTGRSALRDAFDDRAASYRLSPWHREYAEQLVAAAPLTPGMTVLDAAAGTGHCARAVARRIGPDGQVIAVDLSEGMLAAMAAENLAEYGGIEPGTPAAVASAWSLSPEAVAASLGPRDAAPIEAVLGDATQLDLPDGCVDAVTCGAGMLYMQPATALAEWRRVLRPGGIVAFSSMVAGEPPAAALFRLHAAAYGVRLTDWSARLGSEEKCRAALEEAGFTDIEVHPGIVRMTVADLDQAWDVQYRMSRSELAALPEAEVGRLRASYVAELQMRLRTDPAFVQLKTLYAVARRP